MIRICRTFVSDLERLNALLIRITDSGLACNYYKSAAGFIVDIFRIEKDSF